MLEGGDGLADACDGMLVGVDVEVVDGVVDKLRRGSVSISWLEERVPHRRGILGE